MKEGFFYDFFSPSEQVVHDSDYKAIEKAIRGIIGRNLPFEKVVLSKQQALEMFSYNQFKTELIEKKVGDN